MRSRDLPNLISMLRILLVVPIVALIASGYYAFAAILFVAAGLSDGIDGYLAKRYGWTSWVGGILDPVADKLLIVACFVTLGLTGHLPVWLVGLVLLRDLVIVGGAAAYLILIDRFDAEPTLISKANTVAQLALILAVLCRLGFGFLPALVVDALVVLTAVTTLASGVGYVFTWGYRARSRSGQHHAP